MILIEATRITKLQANKQQQYILVFQSPMRVIYRTCIFGILITCAYYLHRTFNQS